MTEKTKYHIARFTVSALVVFVIYLAGAFTSASFDITEWDVFIRGTVASFMVLLWLAAFAIPFYEDFF